MTKEDDQTNFSKWHKRGRGGSFDQTEVIRLPELNGAFEILKWSINSGNSSRTIFNFSTGKDPEFSYISYPRDLFAIFPGHLASKFHAKFEGLSIPKEGKKNSGDFVGACFVLSRESITFIAVLIDNLTPAEFFASNQITPDQQASIIQSEMFGDQRKLIELHEIISRLDPKAIDSGYITKEYAQENLEKPEICLRNSILSIINQGFEHLFYNPEQPEYYRGIYGMFLLNFPYKDEEGRITTNKKAKYLLLASSADIGVEIPIITKRLPVIDRNFSIDDMAQHFRLDPREVYIYKLDRGYYDCVGPDCQEPVGGYLISAGFVPKARGGKGYVVEGQLYSDGYGPIINNQIEMPKGEHADHDDVTSIQFYVDLLS